MASQSTPNSIVISQLTHRLEEIETCLGADVMLVSAPIRFGLDEAIRDAVEAIPDKRRKLAVLLETTGGSIEVTQRIAETLRAHYRVVDFIVPNYAYSAGTVLVMSGDAIYMDYFSVLGPIDPQLPLGDKWIPALGYLEQYNRLIAKDKKGELCTAEMAILINRFDQAELYQYEQAKELSISLLKEWLVKYKFKNWKTTEGRKIAVTKEMRVKRAEEIATSLNTISRWNSHGRGIPMSVLRRDLKLMIEDFGSDTRLNECIKGYYKLFKDYGKTVRHSNAVHTRQEYMAS
jgi:hypothetical protein